MAIKSHQYHQPLGMMWLLLFSFLVFSASDRILAKEANSSGGQNQQQQQPLAGLDKMLKQAQSNLKMDNILDNRLASNMTSTLNEMAANLRKMFAENRRLSSQIQEVMQRVQTVSGLNATNAIANFQQQAPNISSLANMANGMNLNATNLSRFQIPGMTNP